MVLLLLVIQFPENWTTNEFFFIVELIKLVFVNHKCIYYISNYTDFDAILSKVLPNITIQFINIQNFSTLNKIESGWHTCFGFIITTGNITNVANLILEDLEDGERILPYERLLIFYNDNLYTEKFLTAVSIYAVDVIVVEMQIINDLMLPHRLNKIHVKSVYKNLTLATWNKTFMTSDPSDLIQPKWVPSRPFIVTTFNCTPYFYVNDQDQVSGGVEFQIINAILQQWPKQFKIVKSDQKYLKWGIAVDSVSNKSADLATCSQWQIFLNYSKVDATYPLVQMCVTFLVPKPRLLPHFTFIWQPFSTTVWAFTGLMFVSVLVSVLRFSTIYKEFNEDNLVKKFRENKMYTFLYILRLWTLGGLNIIPRSSQFALRFLFGTWFLGCLVYSTYYSAGITSSLTNPRVTNIIKSIKDMVENNVNWLEEEHLKKSLQRSHSELRRRLGDLGVPKTQRNIARITKQLSNLYLTDTEDFDDYDKKHLMVLKQCLGKFYMIFPIKKRSPYKKIIDKYYRRFQEQGLVDFWLRNITYFENSHMRFESMYSIYSDHMDQHNIDIRRFLGAVYLLLVGYCSALVVFLYEYGMVFLTKKAFK